MTEREKERAAVVKHLEEDARENIAFAERHPELGSSYRLYAFAVSTIAEEIKNGEHLKGDT